MVLGAFATFYVVKNLELLFRRVPGTLTVSMIATPQTQVSEPGANFNYGYIWLVSVVAALGGLLFGWDWVVIGGAKPFFERYFQIHDPALVGWANSCALVGCLMGAVPPGAAS